MLGKTTVASIYAALLAEEGIIGRRKIERVTGAQLADVRVGGAGNVILLVEKILRLGGGLLFVDEAYQVSIFQILRYLHPEIWPMLISAQAHGKARLRCRKASS